MEISDSTPQKGSKRLLFFILFLILGVTIVTLILSAAALGQCSTQPDPLDGSSLSVKFVQPALGLPGYETLSWKDITTRANGAKVHFWMADWDIFNEWVDQVLAPRVASRYGITIVRHPLHDTVEAVDAIARERQAGNHKNGSIDLVWINGENFHQAKSANNLYGPWTQACPNAANFDWSASYVAYDDGTPTNGMEMPYNSVQNIYAYNPEYVWDNCTFNTTATNCLPRTMTDILQWATINSGKFTFPSPPDFHGTTFLKNVAVTLADSTPLYGDYSEAKYQSRAKMMWPILKQLYPHLALNASGVLPLNVEEEYAMFGANKTWLVMCDGALDAGAQVDAGLWPATTRAFVPTTGTLTSSDFVAIGYNSPNILAAVVVGNEVADISLQFSRRQPDGLAQTQAFSPSADSITNGGWSVAFDSIKDAPQTPPRSVLRAGAIAPLETRYTNDIERDWVKCVVSKSTDSPCM